MTLELDVSERCSVDTSSMAGATHTATLLKTPMGFGITLTADNVIKGVAKGSQAARDGHFKVGDQVVALNEKPVAAGAKVSSLLSACSNGERVIFGFVTPGEAPKPVAVPKKQMPEKEVRAPPCWSRFTPTLIRCAPLALSARRCPRMCPWVPPWVSPWACRPRRCRWACRTRRQSPRLCSRRHRVIRAPPRASRTQVLLSRLPPCPMIAAAPSHRHR